MQTAVFLPVTILLTANTVANKVSMTIEGSRETKCGENVTLLCFLEDKNMNVMEFSWIQILTANSTRVLCNNSNIEKSQSNGIYCKYEHNQQLELIIERVQQCHNGTYVCKVQTNKGHNSREISQKVTGCSNPANACAAECKWIILLVSLTALFLFILDSGI